MQCISLSRRPLLLLLAPQLMFVSVTTAQTTYFSKPSGNLNVASTWGINTDGSGASPANFSGANTTYVITNRSTAAIAGAWNITGTGSKAQAGDGISPVEFIIPSSSGMSGRLDVANSATLTNENGGNPTLGTLAAGSTVNYARTGNQTVLNANYFNLVLSGSGQKSLANSFGTTITNSLVINAGVRFRLHTVNTLTATLTGSISGDGAILGNGNSVLLINGTGDAGTLTFTTTLSLYQLILDRQGGWLALGSNLTVGNHLLHQNGVLDLNDKLLTVNGALTFPSNSTNGALKGSPSSSLTIGNSTLALTNPLFMDQTDAASRTLSRFAISRVSQTLTLGNDLIVSGSYVHTNAIFDLNGQSLSVGGPITLPAATTNGYFIGSPGSSLSILGAGTIGNALRFDQTTDSNRSLHTFEVDHTGGILTLGSSIICTNSFLHKNGQITLGANELSLEGTILFPVSASNGFFSGSATSSLNVTGAGAITNSLFINQASATARTLGSLVFDRPGETLGLGNSITIGSRFLHSNGAIAIGSALLTLNGTIDFPPTSANGFFTGSATCSLTIGTATTPIVNPIFMDQSGVTERTLSRFSFARMNLTLTIGNDIVVNDAFSHANGVIDLNGQHLSAGGVIALPTSLANGYMVGSTASELSFTGSGAITGALRLDQSSQFNYSLLSFEMNHPGSSLVLGSNLICTGAFSHASGSITLGATNLALNGNILFPGSGNGALTGSATSSLEIGGAGSVGNSLFMSQASAAARTLGRFSIDRTGALLSLGSALIVSSFDQTNGTIDLGNSLLTLNGSVTLPVSASNGVFIGSATASLVIASSTAALTNPLTFSQGVNAARSLSQLSVARSGQTIVLGDDLTVLNAFAHTTGTVNLNGKALTIGGTLTFPATAANGLFTGSAASGLTVNGTGVATNALRLDEANQASHTLGSLVIDRPGTSITFGSHIICDGPFDHVAGTIGLGANSITLNGAISFPVSAANGSITGSTSGTISITGSGSISNPLSMNQSSAANRTIGRLEINRSGTTLALENPLTVNVFSLSSGRVNINGSLLTLSQAITFPANISAGCLIGSLTSSLSIGGSGSVTNPLLLDQSSAANRTLYDLTFARTGQTLQLGNPVEIRNSVTPSAGTLAGAGMLTLKSDGTRSARLGTVGGAITGNITVETHAPGGFTGWTKLGPSGVTGLTVGSWEGQIAMTCPGCPNDEFATGSYFVSIQRFNESGAGAAAYVPLSYTSTLTRGNGYWVYLGTGQFTSSAISWSVNGPAVTGNVSIPLTVSNNSGFNLVSNPYASPIDWDLVDADAANNNVSSSVYFFDPDLGQTVSYAGGLSNPSGYVTNGVIPMGQGFYVQAVSTTNLIFRESHKSSENTGSNPLLKSSQAPGSVFRLSVSGPDGDYDETAFRFHPGATWNFDDGLDAYKFFHTPGYPGYPGTYSRYTSISSRLGNDDYSINSLPSGSPEDLVVPILARARVNGSYTLQPIDAAELPPGFCAMLKDKLLGEEHDLMSGAYVCTLHDTLTRPRFELRFCGSKGTGVDVSLSEGKNTQILQTGDREVTVLLDPREGPATIRVYNLVGQELQHLLATGNSPVQLHFDETPETLLIVEVENKNCRLSKRVLLR